MRVHTRPTVLSPSDLHPGTGRDPAAEIVGKALTLGRAIATSNVPPDALTLRRFTRACLALVRRAADGDPAAHVVADHWLSQPKTAPMVEQAIAAVPPFSAVRSTSAQTPATKPRDDGDGRVPRPMRLLVLSDLHLNDAEWRLLAWPLVDAVLVAGDVTEGPEHAVVQLERLFREWSVPVVFVLGNHEFYRTEMTESLPAARVRAMRGGIVTVLENDALHIVLPGIVPVRVLGASLWTDFAFYGDADHAMAAASRSMLDHRLIRLNGTRFTPADALARHQASVAWLRKALARPFEGSTVVLTHHAPHPSCGDPVFAGDPLTPAFVSDLSDLIVEGRVDTWIYGHVHRARDAIERVTASDGAHRLVRFVSNPLGYAGERTGFRPDAVIEIDG